VGQKRDSSVAWESMLVIEFVKKKALGNLLARRLRIAGCECVGNLRRKALGGFICPEVRIHKER